MNAATRGMRDLNDDLRGGSLASTRGASSGTLPAADCPCYDEG
jgi:hypothetical protein